MSLSPIGSPVFELLKDKHTDRHHITLEYRLADFAASLQRRRGLNGAAPLLTT